MGFGVLGFTRECADRDPVLKGLTFSVWGREKVGPMSILNIAGPILLRFMGFGVLGFTPKRADRDPVLKGLIFSVCGREKVGRRETLVCGVAGGKTHPDPVLEGLAFFRCRR